LKYETRNEFLLLLSEYSKEGDLTSVSAFLLAGFDGGGVV
jgi:hypothetical protein